MRSSISILDLPRRHLLAVVLLAFGTPAFVVACSSDESESTISPGGPDGAIGPDGSPLPDGSLGDSPNDAASDAITKCTSSTTTCVGDNLVVCGDAGAPVSVTACALGCSSATAPACLRLSPSNVPATECDTPGTTALTVVADMAINTDTECDATQAQGGGAPELCIKKFTTVTVNAGTKLTATGARALVLLATGDMNIAGTIDVGGKAAASGPGASATNAGGKSAATQDGAGGAGHSGNGAAGSTTVAGGGGSAGPGYGVAGLVPLLGGASGGANGATAGTTQAAGGGGGGAVQLVSCASFSLAASGVVNAGGGGGAGGPGSLLSNLPGGGGGGGGSGGAILIEAPVATIAGVLAGNGGGGGGGGLRGNLGTAGAAGKAGDDAKPSAVAAAGGTSTAESGAGGKGGVGATAPGVGAVATVSTGSGGGGGGAVGFVRINVRSGAAPKLVGSTVSPQASVGPAGTH